MTSCTYLFHWGDAQVGWLSPFSVWRSGDVTTLCDAGDKARPKLLSHCLPGCTEFGGKLILEWGKDGAKFSQLAFTATVAPHYDFITNIIILHRYKFTKTRLPHCNNITNTIILHQYKRIINITIITFLQQHYLHSSDNIITIRKYDKNIYFTDEAWWTIWCPVLLLMQLQL